jgi:AraC-like DNA-binding protein
LTRPAQALNLDAKAVDLVSPQKRQSPLNCASTEARIVSIAPLVRANVLTSLPAYVKSRGLDYVSLIREVGLEQDEVKEPDTLVSLNRVGHLFDNVASQLGDPAFGIHYAEHLPEGTTGLLGSLVLSAPTVRTSLAAAAEFLAVQTIPVDSYFVEHQGLGHLHWKFSAEFTKPRLQFTGFTSAAFLLRLRLATGPAWEPVAARFDHGTPEALSIYRRFFGPRVKFNQADNGMVVDGATLDLPIPPRPLPVFSHLRELGTRHLTDLRQTEGAQARWDNMTIPQRVRLEIERRLDGSAGLAFDQPTIAASLGSTARHLQAELSLLNTSYDKILVTVREAMAERHLREPSLTLSQISVKLGFSEGSAFTRWARRTYGHSPSVQRDLLRSGASATTATDRPDEVGDDS